MTDSLTVFVPKHQPRSNGDSFVSMNTPSTLASPISADSNGGYPSTDSTLPISYSKIKNLQEKNNCENTNSNNHKRHLSFSLKEEDCSKNEKNEEEFLENKGYVKVSEITKTLQGSIAKYKCLNIKNKLFVIKTTDKELHSKGIVKHDGHIFPVKENILKEKNLNSFLQKRNPSPEFIQFIDFFEFNNKYYMINEFGGQDLFSWVVKNHQLIKQKKLHLKNWRKHVRISFAQMMRFISWLHNDMNICHLDISLENCLVKNAWFDESKKDINKQKCQIKFCDFGVAEMFSNEQEIKTCEKFVGKKGYKSPEVFIKKPFDARKADIWSLGVVLFCMLIGAPPFEFAHVKDCNYRAVVMNKKMKLLLVEYGRLKYMSKFAFDLLIKIFVPEEKRINIQQILKHSYCKDVLKNYGQ